MKFFKDVGLRFSLAVGCLLAALSACEKKPVSKEPKSAIQLESEKLQGDWVAFDKATSEQTGGTCAKMAAFRNEHLFFIQACTFEKADGNVEAGKTYVNIERISTFEVGSPGSIEIKTEMACGLEPEVGIPTPDGELSYVVQGEALTLGGVFSSNALNKSKELGTTEIDPAASEKYGCLGKGSDGKVLFIEKEKFKAALAKFN